MSLTRVPAMAAGAALALAMAATAGPATADSQVTFNGTFTGISFDSGCTNTGSAPTTASGTWRVNLHDSKATARFVIKVGGVPHVAWTTQMTRVADAGTTFTATTTTAAGPLTITLVDSSFTYRISPYNVGYVFPDWPVCEAPNGVTYSGVVTAAN